MFDHFLCVIQHLLHTVSINHKNPLTHLELLDIQRCEQLDELDGLDDEVVVFFIVFALVVFDLEYINKLI